jgi:hypothetical protein
MQVNRTDNLDIRALTQGLTDKPAKAAASTEKTDSLSVGAGGYIEQALALPMDGRASAIEEAKGLLASGELDRLENIREAAEKMVSRGI